MCCVCVCVCFDGEIPLTAFLLMNPPVMRNCVYPQCHWLQGCHGNTVSRINDITATCHRTAGGENASDRETKTERAHQRENERDK